MRYLRFMLAAATLAFSAAGASAAEPVNGTEYKVLDTPVRNDTGAKVEVIEFFMYSCPHCNSLEPLMADWVKKQGDKIAFRRIHFASSDKDPHAHAYLTLEAMGKLEGVHDKIFRAIHVERNRLRSDDAMTDVVVKAGVDKAKYLEYFNSFGVQTKMKRSNQLVSSYKVDSAPTIVIDGRFVTSPAQAGRPGQPEMVSMQNTLAVMDYLVAKAAAEKKAGKK
ncbi:thiol:disulfide interchange protein DsbA/DsbL [Massilia sp. MB5]|uniref:thiol:disulfide interchange protein DsbA/DsbL n=1 Tax=unclassified Massilia TaxID=2609279 RepID=UPI00067C5841|nr:MULTISPECIES: thiol:disulfide interchange protein DsbA/DsbL [unclassified Massilia]AKU24855.1 disulfide bond formation protein DsbA [Massilia sp. NR 4-1]UMR33189.1 thiol:disulfide interchange protein DsbA/DsbL [Massilia sp. MB5]